MLRAHTVCVRYSVLCCYNAIKVSAGCEGSSTSHIPYPISHISGECCSVRLKREFSANWLLSIDAIDWCHRFTFKMEREIRVTAVNVLGPHNHRRETNVADGQPTGQSRLGWPWEQHWSQFEQLLPLPPSPMENLRWVRANWQKDLPRAQSLASIWKYARGKSLHREFI